MPAGAATVAAGADVDVASAAGAGSTGAVAGGVVDVASAARTSSSVGTAASNGAAAGGGAGRWKAHQAATPRFNINNNTKSMRVIMAWILAGQIWR